LIEEEQQTANNANLLSHINDLEEHSPFHEHKHNPSRTTQQPPNHSLSTLFSFIARDSTFQQHKHTLRKLLSNYTPHILSQQLFEASRMAKEKKVQVTFNNQVERFEIGTPIEMVCKAWDIPRQCVILRDATGDSVLVINETGSHTLKVNTDALLKVWRQSENRVENQLEMQRHEFQIQRHEFEMQRHKFEAIHRQLEEMKEDSSGFFGWVYRVLSFRSLFSDLRSSFVQALGTISHQDPMQLKKKK